ncbi:GGDEF domain-containing protein [Phytopseudomonas dryadis]|uniref:diguanylate cyclase n=1 Tax=Phytopseudomonas dryadis TaxID=2487520 RepID=A0ABY1Z5M8_9GAMM|nr:MULTISPECIES: GGDEF domain-containing protein [Pseudomonas]TBV04653.1 GGDEF domain-containing protein [Pseudomonas dryadis]TBV17259.1 GGDEF domain-containing protein [Pseudomonas sp. FRB 230]
MPGLAAVRFSHFLPPLLLLGSGLLASTLPRLSEFFSSLFNVLPTLLLLLGGTFCLVYGRQRELFLLLVLYLGYFVLDVQLDHYREHGRVRDDAALVFHLCSLLLPLLYSLYALWRERTHLIQDLVARAAVLLAVCAVALALARRYPDALQQWLSLIRWPALHAEWMSLVQLAYPLFLIAGVSMLVQYLRTPRPVHAAQLLGLAGVLWMLPNTFIQPNALQAMTSLIMLMIVVGVAHEAYQMAFRDELTGLPGRRALNERLQRLGRSYVIAMADVDHFKKFNDTHGHDVGDQVLRVVASQLRKVGGGGSVYRYGGEEFTLVFAGKTVEACMPHLEAVRQAVEQYRIQLRDRQQRPRDDQQGRQRRSGATAAEVAVTVSIGVAQRTDALRDVDEVIKAADKALYAAKSAGRNCVRSQGQRRGAVKMPVERK